MAKIKYNVKGVDTGGDRTLPKAAVHRCKVTACTVTKPSGKDKRIEVQFQVMDDEPKGSKGYVLYDYINLERDDLDWKLAQFIKAVGLPESGEFDPDEIVGTALNIRVKIRPETEEWAAKAVAGTLIPLDGEEEDPEDLSDDSDDDDSDDDDGEGYTEDDLKGLSNDELKEVAEEVGVEDIPQRLSVKSKPKLIAAILEAQESGDEDEEDEDEDEDGEDEGYTEEDLAEMALADLKEIATDEFELTVPKGKPALVKKKLIAAILEAQGESDDDDEDDDDGDDEDYESMELADLKALCKERKLDTKGTKKVIIQRLQKDDDPF